MRLAAFLRGRPRPRANPSTAENLDRLRRWPADPSAFGTNHLGPRAGALWDGQLFASLGGAAREPSVRAAVLERAGHGPLDASAVVAMEEDLAHAAPFPADFTSLDLVHDVAYLDDASGDLGYFVPARELRLLDALVTWDRMTMSPDEPEALVFWRGGALVGALVTRDSGAEARGLAAVHGEPSLRRGLRDLASGEVLYLPEDTEAGVAPADLDPTEPAVLASAAAGEWGWRVRYGRGPGLARFESPARFTTIAESPGRVVLLRSGAASGGEYPLRACLVLPV